MTTEPLRRMAIASCDGSACRDDNTCLLNGGIRAQCEARARRCLDAILPLSDEQKAATWIHGVHEAPEDMVSAIIAAAKGDA